MKTEYLQGVFTEMPTAGQIVPAPAASLPEPDRITWQRAMNLASMAWYCFPEID